MDSNTPSRHVLSGLRLLSRISRTPTVSEAKALLMRALKPFGITYYAAWIAAAPDLVDRRSTIITNWPDEWLDQYLDEEKYRYDPIVARATQKPGSFFWHELDLPSSPQVHELLREAREHDMEDGYTLSWRSPLPTTTIMSLAGQPLFWNDAEEQAVSAIADAFVARAMYLRGQAAVPIADQLTAQERRLLHLAATGLSDRKIGEILGINRGSILSQWKRLRAKLSAADRVQAVANGIKAGEIAF